MRASKARALLLAACTACVQFSAAQAIDTPPASQQSPAPAPFPPVKDKQAVVAPGFVNRPFVNKLFYLPTRDEPATPATWGYGYRQVNIISKDGTRLNGWWIESKAKPVLGTVVFSHGTAGSMGHHLGFVMWLAKAGYDVLIYDYRGYGKSQGSTDRQGMVLDAHAALDFAADQNKGANHKVISYGHSMGGAKSIAAIADSKPSKLRAVITDAAFASYRDMALTIGGKLAGDLVSDELSPVDQIAKISPLPVLIIHGKKDPVVPFAQGQKLFDAAKKPKTMFEVQEGGHGNNLWRDEGAYRKRMLEWLEENLKG